MGFLKKATLVLAILLICSTSFAAQGQAYEGISTYDDLFKNINFSDINNHWAEKYINTMSTLSIIKGMGKQNFKPQDKLTYEQAVVLIMRLLGYEKEAKQIGQNSYTNIDTANNTILSAYDNWIKGYIQLAKSKGIITNEDVKNITLLDSATTERIEIETDEFMAYYDANLSITQQQLNNIRRQAKEKITRKYTWQKFIPREEIAIYVARTIGLSPIEGNNQQKIYTLKDYTSIKPSYLPLIEAVLQNDIMSGNSRGYFKPKDTLSRAEMTKILYNIANPILINNGYKIGVGIVKNVQETTLTKKDALTGRVDTLVSTVFSIKDDYEIKDIYTERTEDGDIKKGFIVIDKNKLSKMNVIREGDTVKYYITPENKAVLIEKLKTRERVIEGFIEMVEGDYVSFTDYNDKNYKLQLAKGSTVRVNGESIAPSDLLYGQEVKVKLINDKISEITSSLEIGDEGYIDQGDRIVVGKVLMTNKFSGGITLATEDKVNQYTIKGYISILKDGKSVTFDKIKNGDYLRLEFDDYKSISPSKVIISADDIQISALYKARIQDIDAARNKVILGDLNLYKNGSWSKEKGNKDLALKSGCKMYTEDLSLDLNTLKNFRGREVYVALQDNFGQPEIIKLVMKNDYETKYMDSIQRIEYGSNSLRVDYKNIGFDYNSTIIVKDNRLIHPFNLSKGDDILVYSYGINSPKAAFISVQGTDIGNMVVYRGRLDEIGNYSIELDKMQVLEDNEWYNESKQTEFNISNDTKIIDTRKSTVKDIKVEDFTNSRFLKDTDEDNYYKKYVYAVEYGNMILAMNIIDKGTDANVVTTATVESVDSSNASIKLKDINDYSFFEEKWISNNGDISLSLNKAIFIKDGKVVNFSSIQKEDKLYVLRENSRGDIIIIR